MPEEIIKKEDIKEWIQDYANKCGVLVIKLAFGTNGTSWKQVGGQPNYSEGVYAMCDGIAEAINKKIVEDYKERIEELRDELIQMVQEEVEARESQVGGIRSKLQNDWKGKINEVITEVDPDIGHVEDLP